VFSSRHIEKAKFREAHGLEAKDERRKSGSAEEELSGVRRVRSES